MAPATFDGFFDLPGELREQILTYLLVKPDGIHIDTCSRLELLVEISPERRINSHPLSLEDSDDDERDELVWPLNYFLVSQTFHREASAVFFGENEFHLYAMASRLFLRGHSSGERWWPETRGKNKGEHEYKHIESLRRIRRVVLYGQRLGGVLETLFLPVLREMTLSGGLKHLDVRMYLVVQRAQGPASLWGSRLGRGLLGLLRDPDLDVARLRIFLNLLPGSADGKERDGEEVATWCPRREGPGGRLVTMTDREGRVWCDMDIEELARSYGGEEVGIFKVGERPMLRWAAA